MPTSTDPNGDPLTLGLKFIMYNAAELFYILWKDNLMAKTKILSTYSAECF